MGHFSTESFNWTARELYIDRALRIERGFGKVS